MIDPVLENRIAVLRADITANLRTERRLQDLMQRQTSELLSLEAERDRIADLKTRVMDTEIQAAASYHGGKLHD